MSAGAGRDAQEHQPSAAAGSESADLRRRAHRRQLIRAAGLLIGVALVGAAAWYAARDRATLNATIAALQDAPPLLLAALAGCVLLNLALTGALFSVLMSRYGRVGLIEMQALTASTALLNFLPLRPGLFGRVAYHRLVNTIAIRDTAKVIVGSVLLTAIVTLALLGAIVVSNATGARLWMLIGAVGAVPQVAALLDRRLAWAASASLLRLADVLVWSARYYLLFELVGRPIGFDAAVALAAVSIFATMAPFLSNGLGLREWAVGLAAPMLVDTFGGAILDGRIAIAAELVHRGVEILIIGIAGGVGLLSLAARRRKLEQLR